MFQIPLLHLIVLINLSGTPPVCIRFNITMQKLLLKFLVTFTRICHYNLAKQRSNQALKFLYGLSEIYNLIYVVNFIFETDILKISKKM